MDTCSIIMAVALYNTKDAQHTALLGLFSFSDEDEILENGLNQLLLLCVSACFADTSFVQKILQRHSSCCIMKIYVFTYFAGYITFNVE